MGQDIAKMRTGRSAATSAGQRDLGLASKVSSLHDPLIFFDNVLQTYAAAETRQEMTLIVA